MNWYCYLLIDPRTGCPFYVGKGQRNRINAHHQEARRGHKCPKCAKIRKLWQEGRDYTRLIVFRSDDEQAALDLEVLLISGFRARGVKLCNLAAGGQGVSGYSPPAAILLKRGAAIKAAYQRPESKQRLREAMDRLLADPEFHAKRRAGIIRAQARPEYRAKMSVITNEHWSRPEYRAKHQASMQAVTPTPGFRARVSAGTKAALAAPEARAAIGERSKAEWADPVKREQRIEAITAANSTPEARRKFSEQQRAYSATPEGKAARIRAAQASALKRAVLTPEQQAEIRSLHSTGSYTHKMLAERFGVSQTSIGRALAAQTDRQ